MDKNRNSESSEHDIDIILQYSDHLYYEFYNCRNQHKRLSEVYQNVGLNMLSEKAQGKAEGYQDCMRILVEYLNAYLNISERDS